MLVDYRMHSDDDDTEVSVLRDIAVIPAFGVEPLICLLPFDV